jgi:penicillin-binding protein 2
VIRPKDRIFCPGHFRLGRRTYRCWKRSGHGSVDLREALKRSCDVYFYTVGLKVGVDRTADYARMFGLGRVTGIPLAQEKPGLIPTAEWKERRFKEPWVLGETVSTSIGQGFNLATPLQMAVAYGALANGGRVVEPRIVLSRVDEQGIVTDTPPTPVRRQVTVSEANLALIRESLEAVVGEPGGTGGRSRVQGIRVAGKTGTAQVVRLKHTEDLEEHEIPMKYRDHAWFVAFAPVESPEIVVAVVAEHGGHGGSAAAPIAQKVLAKYFEKQRPPEEEQQLAEASRVGSDASRAAPAPRDVPATQESAAARAERVAAAGGHDAQR